MAYETIVIQRAQNSSAPKPAVGRHLEQLGECDQWLDTLKVLIQKERNGTFDDLGLNWWIERDVSQIGASPDPLINVARKILQAAERRLGEWKDANAR